MKQKQEHTPLTKEEYMAIKPGDVIERMLAFSIPVYLVVQNVENGIIDACWTFDANTGLEIDKDIPSTVSYIRRVLTDEQKAIIKNGDKLKYP